MRKVTIVIVLIAMFAGCHHGSHVPSEWYPPGEKAPSHHQGNGTLLDTLGDMINVALWGPRQ